MGPDLNVQCDIVKFDFARRDVLNFSRTAFDELLNTLVSYINRNPYPQSIKTPSLYTSFIKDFQCP